MSWNIIGHEWAVAMLKEHLIRGEVRHAYLFCGPQGIGRRTLALRYAQAINCLRPPAPGEPCLTCRSCLQIDKMQHPDLHIVQSEQPGGLIKVDQVRELNGSLARTPYEGKYHIALLLRFENAHPSAANALLKTLEEPGSRVILMLTAESPESVLATIASRCEVMRLRPMPFDSLNQELAREWGVSTEEAQRYTALSGGRPGYAKYLYQNPSETTQRNAWLDEHSRLLSARLVERFDFVDGNYKDRANLLKLLPVWLSFWRDVLLAAAQSAHKPVNLDREAEIDWLAHTLGLETARKMVSSLDRTVGLLDQNINVRLALEVLMLDLPHIHTPGPVGSPE